MLQSFSVNIITRSRELQRSNMFWVCSYWSFARSNGIYRNHAETAAKIIEYVLVEYQQLLLVLIGGYNGIDNKGVGCRSHYSYNYNWKLEREICSTYRWRRASSAHSLELLGLCIFRCNGEVQGGWKDFFRHFSLQQSLHVYKIKVLRRKIVCRVLHNRVVQNYDPILGLVKTAHRVNKFMLFCSTWWIDALLFNANMHHKDKIFKPSARTLHKNYFSHIVLWSSTIYFLLE